MWGCIVTLSRSSEHAEMMMSMTSGGADGADGAGAGTAAKAAGPRSAGPHLTVSFRCHLSMFEVSGGVAPVVSSTYG